MTAKNADKQAIKWETCALAQPAGIAAKPSVQFGIFPTYKQFA
jgi:hypothetical protein